MPRQKEDLTLYGGRAERFREIREQLEEEYGYEPSKPEVVGELMREFDDA